MLNLTRRNPWSELRSLQREFDSFFNSAFSAFGTQPLSDNASPSADLVRKDDAWLATIALPGIAPEEMQIDVTGRTLHVRGERHVEKTTEGEPYLSEIVRGKFERTFTLPDEIDADKVRADYRHGLLELTLPIKESARPRRISIGSGKEKDVEARQLTTA